MAITKCEKGHFYDDEKYQKCPHCEADSRKAENNDNELTVARISDTIAKKSLAAFVAGNDERTVSIFSSKDLKSPVVGWLVCISGNEKGRDYRIKSGRNFIGRAHQMDITIADDQQISRDKHCSVVFDPKSIQFSLVPGSGVAYLNGEKVTEPRSISPYDKISLGQSEFQFVPFCKEGVMW